MNSLVRGGLEGPLRASPLYRIERYSCSFDFCVSFQGFFLIRGYLEKEEEEKEEEEEEEQEEEEEDEKE